MPMSDQTIRCAQVLNQALHTLFENHPDVYLIGEDLLDPVRRRVQDFRRA